MGLFGCKACEARDNEIAWLRHELEQARRTVAEALKPGISRVVEAAEKPEPIVPPESPRPARPTFPGYEPGPPREVEVS